ncbi:ABC transporter ATP-binding protein [Fulvivirga sedimenti]|uniref:ABC transporter ATP-binding protein n=1 Tax=Fulvivirga sedimenti TaxID=2879465 RepID=A0A9X1HW49_9BACT|nr:ABC transporter ATP-binding protein [Fulvivirga sedimenti]MCA6075072.1 ABC transporter ATP-binding protein [Fulvivirga sedimenti]MCA6076249.1 ABC transporter ATP-binding protein [Fulvivirga sedimenti]MCA6077377.1 ABC transporter ATP-binding protein [Fulvivirga sedimenti]
MEPTTAKKIVIRTQDISKTYHESKIPVQALKDVDLEVAEGEFTAIVGPSGSGKTTFLNILGGLDNPTTGTIEIDGTDISKLKESELIDFRLHNIGFVFQQYNLIPVLTAKENVEFIMLLQKRPGHEMKERAMKLLAEVGLEDKANVRPSELSGGQQQRVAVIRALASRPKFILADEPTANLDSVSAANLLDMMARMNREEGITFIFSTHDQRVIDKARRVVTLEDGVVKSDEVRS